MRFKGHVIVAKAIDRVPSETMRLLIEAPRVITETVRVPIKNGECAHIEALCCKGR
jgi:hypothetical protein